MLFRIAAASAMAVGALADVSLVTFDGQSSTTFKFTELNDPVMGGKSTGTWKVNSTGEFGVFDGEVVDVPSLKAPGFIKAAADGSFNDASSEAAGDLVMYVRTDTPDFGGFRVTVVSGTMSPSYSCAGGGSLPLSRGCYKAKFSVPAGSKFVPIRVPFSAFSDLWSPSTGELTKTCQQQADACLTAKQLSSIKRIEVWAEGAAGKVHLEVLAIAAGSAQANEEAKALATAKVSSVECPKSAAFVHASCSQTATLQTSCATVAAEIKARVSGQPGAWHDPHNNGTYSISSATDSVIELQRTTGDKKYTDKMAISLTGTGDLCTLSGCSVSQVTSVADFSTNFCNVRVLYCGTNDGCKFAKTDLTSTVSNVNPSIGAGKTMSDCLKV